LHHEEQTSSSIKIKTTFDRSMTHPPQEFHFGKVKDEKQNEQKKVKKEYKEIYRSIIVLFIN